MAGNFYISEVEAKLLRAHKKAAALIKEMSIFGSTRGVVDSAQNSGSKGSEVDGSSISSETDARIEGLVSGTGFSMCVAWKVILLNTQSINRLKWVSQLYPRTTMHEGSSI